MDSLPACLRQLRRQIRTYRAQIRTLQRLPTPTFPKLLIPYYEELIRVNTEVIAILERQAPTEKEKNGNRKI